MLICCVILMISHILDQQCAAIFGGREVDPHSRPYMVLIERKMKPGNTRYCSGFLLNEHYVMTAADCEAERLWIVDDGVQHIPVERAFPHKSFNPDTFINDMMLLKLSSKAKFNNRVGPISISGQGEGRQPKSCSVTGWGPVDLDKPDMTFELIEINVTLIDDQDCVKNNLYCSTSFIAISQGGQGSPLVCDGHAFGVTSFINLKHPTSFYGFTKLPDSRKLAELFLDRRPVCGRAADSNKKFYVKD